MLEVSHLDAWYGESHILHDVNVGVPDGRRVAILGRNGAGKTTIFKSIMNGGPQVEGKIAWQGNALGTMPSFRRARLGLALVPEDRRIFQHITVAENIEMAAYATTADRPAIPAADIMRRFPMLGPLASRLGGQLSGGQQQMLAVARAVAARPRLLLVDEPAEGLAPVIVEQLSRDLRDVCNEYDVGLLLSEQNVWFARQCTSELYIIETGRVVFHGEWSEFDARADELHRHLAM